MLPPIFPGLPSLHGIIEGIANGFFGALATALVPGFLKHATVGTIQALVALPDPATWPHVSQLQGDMTYLAVLLLPVTLAAGALRYWLLGLMGGPSPLLAVGRCGWATGVLVGYRWLVEQTVAGANTLTHALLGFPAVSGGLGRIVGVLFGGALLVGAGGVFGALLVIVGVIFAAALFAAQVLVTLVLALLVVAGPLLIAVSAVPELSHLARSWVHALLAVALVPVGWTVLFATAGALALDATSFTGGAGGLPEHVAAAFAGLITFMLAVRLPIILFSQARYFLFAGAGAAARGTTGSRGAAEGPGASRVRTAQARLRSIAFDAVPAAGRTVGFAAGALGAPRGGPAGALRRRVARTTGRASSERPEANRGRTARARVTAARDVLGETPRRAREAIYRAERPASPGRSRYRQPRDGERSAGVRVAGGPDRMSSTRRVAVRTGRAAAAGSGPRPAGTARAPGTVSRGQPRSSTSTRALRDRPPRSTRPTRAPGMPAAPSQPRSSPARSRPVGVRARRKPRPGSRG
ncbi:MAG: hypothetical protein JWM60_1683 [Solirubrobacterales bacterium]|nr:hypothetical protein [Solirubrobacterales bacterium]